MKLKIGLLSLIAALTTLVGCAQLPSTQSDGKILAQLDDIATGALQTRPSVLEFNGKPAILYATKSDRVAFQVGGQQQLLDETARIKGLGRYFQLKADGQKLAALWWSHQDGKNAYFAASEDGGQKFSTVNVINDEHGILHPINLVSPKQGNYGVSYLDERATGYQVYANKSMDGGRTWATPDQRLDTPPTGRSSTVFEPQSIMVGSTWVVVWTDITTIDSSNTYRILTRHSTDAGVTWSPEAVIYSTGHQPTSLKLRAVGNTVVVAADEVSHGIFALISNDQGGSWKNTGFLTETGSFTNSGIDMALTEGRAYLVWMQELPNVKVRNMVGTLDVSQATWVGSPKRLDAKTDENTKAMLPVILAQDAGPVVTAWVDYRDIRPNIYLSASFDKGQSWSVPQALLMPGQLSAGWPQLLPWGNKVAIAYEIYPADKATEGKFIVRQLDLGGTNAKAFNALPQPEPITESERKARLQQRIQELWTARVAGNYDKAYDYFDFAYRAAVPKQHYTVNAGVINYLGFNVDNMDLTGNEASVNMKVKYEIKPMIVPFTGKPLEVKPMDVDLPTKWVWVGTDWFLVYAPAFDQQALKY